MLSIGSGLCCAALLAVSSAAASGLNAAVPAGTVATVLGQPVACLELRAADVDECATAVLRQVVRAVGRDYVQRRGLAATPSELAALGAYHQAFASHDRAQRTSKLADLEKRLADPHLTADERDRLQAFRDVLERLARFDADVDAGIEHRDAPSETRMRAEIEEVKLNIALYARYGGVLALTPAGPYPHGARAALVDSYVERGDIVFFEHRIATRFVAALRRAPRFEYRGTFVDLGPYWERPLVASYMADAP